MIRKMIPVFTAAAISMGISFVVPVAITSNVAEARDQNPNPIWKPEIVKRIWSQYQGLSDKEKKKLGCQATLNQCLKGKEKYNIKCGGNNNIIYCRKYRNRDILMNFKIHQRCHKAYDQCL